MLLETAAALGYATDTWHKDFKQVWEASSSNDEEFYLVRPGEPLTADMEVLCKEAERWIPLNPAQYGLQYAAVSPTRSPVRRPIATLAVSIPLEEMAALGYSVETWHQSYKDFWLELPFDRNSFEIVNPGSKLEPNMEAQSKDFGWISVSDSRYKKENPGGTVVNPNHTPIRRPKTLAQEDSSARPTAESAAV